MGIFPYLEDVIRLNVVSADRGVCSHVAVGVVVEALGPCRLVVLLLPPQYVELLHLLLQKQMKTTLINLKGKKLRFQVKDII